MATINGTAGNDELLTVESNDELLGLEGNDLLDAVSGKGNNTLRGGAGNDELFAYNQDQLFGDEGDDDLYSDGIGNNLLDGGEGDDEIFPDLNDTVNGGAGDDVIFAGRGGNTFTGGSGKDIFWTVNVESPENPNTITDFNFIEETIRVDLAGVESFDDLSITQQGNDAIINAGGRQIAIVEGVTPNQLNETNVVTDNNTPDNPTINQSPSFDDATFSIAENSLEGTSIGTLSANDEDEDDILTYAITAGNLDVDGDGNNAFRIDENSDTLLVNDSDDLDFEKNPQFDLSVSVSDNSGDSDTATITINLQDEFDETPSIEDATFSVRENSAAGTVIGAVEAEDSDRDDVLSYSITTGNLDVDGDGSSAFIINSNGEIIVNDRDDLDFEKNPNFDLSVTVTDSNNLSDTANITVELQDEPLPEFDAEQSKQGIFSLIGDTKEAANILFNLVSSDADNINEIGVFAVDENNAVNGITPDSPDYIKEALQQSQIVFSAINNQPDGYAELDNTRILEGYQSGERLVFYLVQNSTTDNVLSGKTSSDNVLLGSTFGSDAFAQVKIADMGDGKFELAWEDQIGGGDEDFNDLKLNLEITDAPALLGTNFSNPPELIDLREFAGETVDMTAQVFREAAFDNQVVFYRVDSADGIIGSFDPDTASESDYLNQALNNLVTDINGDVIKLEADNQSTASFTAEVNGGSIFAPMIIVDGSLENLQDDDTSNNPTVYFPYIGANSDTVDHMRLLGDNTFGFEDLANGGDMDYNDMIVKVELS